MAPRASHLPQDRFLRPVGTTGVRAYSLAAATGNQQSLSRLPYCIRVLAENVLRHIGRNGVSEQDLALLLAWLPKQEHSIEVPFHPARVLMQDYTGIPSLVDLAMLRDGIAEAGGDCGRVNPRIPVDLVIDHSLIVDSAGSADSEQINLAREYERNAERFALARWAQCAFSNLRVVPPGRGILHQINIEHLAQVVRCEDGLASPDTMVGTDSHSTMVNGLGVLGWGVGGIEAEAAMLGLPLITAVRSVVGVRLSGALRPGVTATDLVLTLTQLLRTANVVDAMLEFCGSALDGLPVADRATLANMAPEYGSNCAFFPVDEQTLAYLRLTGRDPTLVEAYARFQGLWRDDESPQPDYSRLIDIDLGRVEPCIAGPGKPSERQPLGSAAALHTYGPGLCDGAVVIAAITSCTNTSNPSVMMAAGLLAQRAVKRGLKVPPWVKTSLTPGSRAVADYLRGAGLLDSLDALGFQVAGYGCATCGGNSGELMPSVEHEVRERGLLACSVLSGNRNFEARIHQEVRFNYLMSPPLVIAYAIAGHMGLNLARDPLGLDHDGRPVMLHELWPSDTEIQDTMRRWVGPEVFERGYRNLFGGGNAWERLPAAGGQQFAWDLGSTYIRRPPYLEAPWATGGESIKDARALLLLGDGITTDHISPVGAIAAQSPAATYLRAHGVAESSFNAYGARRANHDVMVRGTFANIRLRNALAGGREGGWTRLPESEELLTVFDAAERYRAQDVPLIIVAGHDYGTGSSRDWAAKGTRLLGVRAVLARSFERIHRANLAYMGVLPLQFEPGISWESLGFDGSERFGIDTAGLTPSGLVGVDIQRSDGTRSRLSCRVRLDTANELEVWAAGGMLPFVQRGLQLVTL